MERQTQTDKQTIGQTHSDIMTKGAAKQLPPSEFLALGKLSENLLLVGKLSSRKCKSWDLEPILWGNLKGKLKA